MISQEIRNYSKCQDLYDDILVRVCEFYDIDVPDNMPEFLGVDAKSLRYTAASVFMRVCHELSDRNYTLILRVYRFPAKNIQGRSSKWHNHYKVHPELASTVEVICEQVRKAHCTNKYETIN